MKKAVVLCSGGLDSSTAMAMACHQKFDVFALSFDYGQRHRIEVERAKEVVSTLGIKNHLVQKLEFKGLGESALTSLKEIPKDRDMKTIASEIPPTYVPARNTIFLSFGLALAEGWGAEAIFFGANAVDYSGYPDCRPEFIRAFEKMANLATKMSVEGKLKFRIKTPLLFLSKAEIVLKGKELGVPFHLTHSCYDPAPTGISCGRCDSCKLRKRGFQEAGLEDPLPYLD
ncbi:MAG TPA: 7-cyano-7-deazaguanine synthase QueC [Nitrospiria bacterium]|jgi:7-cyano-7-deazaguanine synthase